MSTQWQFNPFTGNLDKVINPSEAIAHSELSDMPDTGGTNSDHDARYFTETEVNTNFLKLDQTSAQTITASPVLNWLTVSKVVFTDASKQLTSTGIGTSSQFIKGDGSLDSTSYWSGSGSGADTRVAYWTGTSTLSSNANFVYQYNLDNLKVGNINLPNAGAFLFGTNNNDGCWRFVRATNDFKFDIFGSSNWNEAMRLTSNKQIFIGRTTDDSSSCKLQVGGTLGGISVVSDSQFTNKVSLSSLAQFYVIDESNRVRLSIGNGAKAQQSTTLLFFGDDGGLYTGNNETKWELGTDYNMNGTQTFYLYDSKNSALRWIVDSSGYFDAQVGYKCGGTSPAADGTYSPVTSITIKGGIITAIS
jgi:hypothetical protein